MTKTLFELLNEHSEVSEGIRLFPVSGGRYKQRLGRGCEEIVFIPIIDSIERTDMRIEGLPDDVYATALKREGVLR